MYIETNDYSRKPPTICISELEKNQNSKFKVHLLNSSQQNDISYETNPGSGICYAKDIILPQRVISSSNNTLNRKYSYDGIFVVQNYNRKCNAYIINQNNTYYWLLPSFEKSSVGQNLVYIYLLVWIDISWRL